MLKIFSTMTGFLGLRADVLRDCADACADWLRDPMSHPRIAGMDLSQLADLPAGQLRARVRE